MRKTKGEQVFDAVNVVGMVLIILITLYPFLYVVFASLSNPIQFMGHQGILLKPQGLSFKAYEAVFKNKAIYTGYRNTIFYVIVGVTLNLFLTSIAAYVLSRKYLKLTKYIMILIILTMYFSGGLIPNYLLIKQLGIDNTRLALIFPTAISTWNLIIMRTSVGAIPEALEESARIDGAGEWTILFRIILPLSLPILSVMALYYGVAHWNAWFNAMIYLRDRSLYPLQLFLREILIQNELKELTGNALNAADATDISITVKYATIIASTLPILLIYPFIQKFFVQGVMIGAVKG